MHTRTHGAITMAMLVGLLGLAAPAAAADDFFWTNDAGGRFGDAANWDDGEGDIPREDDTAVFDLAAIFDVEFDLQRTTERVIVRSGIVAFFSPDGRTYTLLGELPSQPSAVVGVGDGDVAQLVLTAHVHGIHAAVALEADSIGTLIVSGAAGRLENDGELIVGNGGVGTFELVDGATAQNTRGTIGQLDAAYGSATVSGAGSTWTSSAALTVGRFGTGLLLVEDGGVVTSGDGIVGQEFGALSVVTIDGAGSAWIIDGPLDVGMEGTASLVVSNGASLSNHTFATVGTFPGDPKEDPEEAGGVGNVTVSGAGSTWSIDGDLYAGLLSDGIVEAQGGGRIEVTGDLFLNLHRDLLEPLVITLADAGDYPAAAIDVWGLIDAEASDRRCRVDLDDAYEPAAGDTFSLVAATGNVDLIDVTLPPIGGALTWELTQTPTELSITIVAEPCTADVDGDGTVGFQDLIAVLAAFGDTGGPADVDRDGFVGFEDVIFVLANWGPCP